MTRFLVVFSFMLLLAVPVSQALVIDAPHNSTNGITCSACHSYSLWWQYSPTTQNPSPNDHAAIVDAVCMTCHDGAKSEPKAVTHSSAKIGSNLHDTWGVGCMACHDPHIQNQLFWVDSPTKPYLVTGTITGVSYDSILKRTTISYSGATTNANWPAEGSVGADRDWSNKSFLNPDRGLILVHDSAEASSTFPIVTADSSQIVVRGELDASAIDTGYVNPQTLVQNSGTCNTFGLIYGQLVKSSIASKSVRFFDPIGGFVEEGPSTTGICQVCHVDTSRFTSSGVFPTGADTHTNRVTENCSRCHMHRAGFKGIDPTYHGNPSFAWAGNCATCHNVGNAVTNIVAETHGGNCGLCHVDPEGGGNRQDGDSANGTDGSALGAGKSSTCVDCHLTTLSLTSAGIHHQSAHSYAATGDCAQCHQDAVGKLTADHSATIASSVNCDSCHAQNVGTASGAPVDPASPSIHDACTTCHESTGLLKAAYGTASAMPAGGGACEACHGAYFISHDHGSTGGSVNHSVQVDPATDISQGYACSQCHSVQNWPNIMTTHLSACATCHAASRDINPGSPIGITVAMVIANANQATVNCLDCHATPHPPVPDHSAAGLGHVLDTPFCVGCHPANAPMAVHLNKCNGCHTSPPVLAEPFNRQWVHAVTRGSCTGCHWDFMGSHNHNHTATLTATASCVNCHAGDIVTSVHKDICFTCHASSNGARIVGANGNGDATVNGGSGGTCVQCHAGYFNSHDHNHANQVKKNVAAAPTTANCVGCHTATTAPFIGMGEVHSANGCASCHSASNGALIGSTVAGGGECVDCHAGYFNGHDHGATGGAVDHAVQIDPLTDLGQADYQPCSNCHSVLNWPNILAAHLSSCGTCHNANRDINPVAPVGTTVQYVITGYTGTIHCLDCHQDKANGGVHPPYNDHLGDVLDTPFCVGCHPANAPMAVHLYKCGSCHTNPPNLQDPAIRPMVVVILPGATCTGCHGTDYFPGPHGHDHSATVTATASCLNCHTGNIITSVHKNLCFTCHSSVNGALIIGANGNGDATVNSGNGGSCDQCHTSYFTNHDHNHATQVKKNVASAPATANCVGCHSATTTPFIGSGEVHSANGCASCHSATDGALIGSAVAGGGECVSCHTGYFNGHDHGSTGGVVTHTVQINPLTDLSQADLQPCSVCHMVQNWPNILVTHLSSCGTCHTSSRDINPASPTGTTVEMVIADANQTEVNCLNCHQDKANGGIHPPGGIDHSTHVLDTLFCVGCHQANNPMAVHLNKCSSCHTSPPFLQDPANRPRVVAIIPDTTCIGCHGPNYFTGPHGHDHSATVTSTASCLNCHSGEIITGVHKNLCFSCHSSVNGVLIVGANGNGDATVNGGNGGSCDQCHTSYFTNHDHNHATQVKKNVASAPATANCVGCHSATTTPFIGSGEVHSANGCASCHSTTDGALIGPAVAGGGECVSCHAGYFYGHDHGSTGGTVDHTVICNPSTDISLPDSKPCSYCHLVQNWTNILINHLSSCATCHDASRDINPVTPTGTTVQYVIMNYNSTIHCLDCHLDKMNHIPPAPDHSAAGFSIVLDTPLCVSCHQANDPMGVHGNRCSNCHTTPPALEDPINRPLVTAIIRGATCTGCHTQYFNSHNHDHATQVTKNVASTSATANCVGCHSATNTPFVGSGEVHNANGCASCHSTTDGALIGSAVAGGGECVSCHTTYFNGHSHGLNHDALMRATDLYNGNACNTCHRRGGTASANPMFVNVWSGTDGILALHQNSCDLCHTSSRTINVSAGYASVSDVITSGANVGCLDCHADRVAHPDPHDFDWDGNCNTCHAGVIIAVHNDTCGVCHVNPSGGGPRRIGTDGDATKAVSGQTDTCLTCHPTTTYPAGTIHHDTANAINFSCFVCHASGGDHSARVSTSPSCNLSTCHPVVDIVGTSTGIPVSPTNNKIHDACSTCHVSNGALQPPYGKAVAMPVGGGTCEACHGPYSHPDYIHVMPPVVLCLNCHTATTAPFVAIGQVHAGGCATCHNVMTGVTIGSAAGKTNGANCQTCHATYFDGHLYNHSLVVRVNTATTPTTANCIGCHSTATVSPFVSSGQTHAQQGCPTCHSPTTGALIGSATGQTTGGECATCHGAFDGHSHSHDVLMRTWDLSSSSYCNTCHRRGGTASGNPLFSNSWSGTDGILALHQNSCDLCHTSTRTANVAPMYTSVSDVIASGTNVGCLDCHLAHAGHDFVWGGNCNTCHPGADITVDVHKAKCSICHVNPAGGGPRRGGPDGDATLDISGQPASCLTCHPAVTYPSGGIHHDTTKAVNNNCLACHGAGLAKADHSTAVSVAISCVNCHTSTSGASAGVPTDMENGRVHDACRTCHTFDANLKGMLVAATGKRGVTAMPAGGSGTGDGGGPCTVCHTATMASVHHSNGHALIGECEYCHADPRNKVGGTLFQETVSVPNPIPNHLPCEECHVTPKATSGWANNQMTILAFQEGSSHSTTNYSTDFTRATAHSGGHVIANSVGRINNWGICFSCHDGITAVRVNPFHAKPVTYTATNSSCGTSGTARYAPGREATNTIGNFDFFASTFRPASTRPGGSGSCKQVAEWTGAVKYGSTDFTPTDTLIPDPWSTATVTVPMFPGQTSITTTTPAADNVQVSSAIWNGANIVVTATNTSGCTALTAVYNGSSQPFGGTTTCTATFASSVVYSSSVPTLNVTTSNPDGLGVTGYRVSTP